MLINTLFPLNKVLYTVGYEEVRSFCVLQVELCFVGADSSAVGVGSSTLYDGSKRRRIFKIVLTIIDNLRYIVKVSS